MSDVLSALVITYNEEANIYRTLSSIQWIPNVLILDSGSTDRTIEIVNGFRNTKVLYRDFDTFANQCNYGLMNIDSEWVLSLDADYIITSSLAYEIQTLLTPIDLNETILYDAYKASFRYCVNGKPIRSGLLPPRACLYKRKCARYVDEGHGHRVLINGRTGQLLNRILHDDRKSIGSWLDSQKKYQSIEATMLSSTDSTTLPIQDLLRKHTFLAPFVAFFMCIFLRGGIFDGKEGLIYALQRVVAESLLFLSMHCASGKDNH